jgi:hypothetical protein
MPPRDVISCFFKPRLASFLCDFRLVPLDFFALVAFFVIAELLALAFSSPLPSSDDFVEPNDDESLIRLIVSIAPHSSIALHTDEDVSLMKSRRSLTCWVGDDDAVLNFFWLHAV